MHPWLNDPYIDLSQGWMEEYDGTREFDRFITHATGLTFARRVQLLRYKLRRL